MGITLGFASPAEAKTCKRFHTWSVKVKGASCGFARAAAVKVTRRGDIGDGHSFVIHVRGKRLDCFVNGTYYSGEVLCWDRRTSIRIYRYLG